MPERLELPKARQIEHGRFGWVSLFELVLDRHPVGAAGPHDRFGRDPLRLSGEELGRRPVRKDSDPGLVTVLDLTDETAAVREPERVRLAALEAVRQARLWNGDGAGAVV